MNISGFKQQCGQDFGDGRELNFGGSVVKGCRSGKMGLMGQFRIVPTADSKELLKNKIELFSSNLPLGSGGNNL